ncbi:MAG TPA: lysylphosphatidylglycerol synthase domain-containing protein, partial [Gemmatimonadales bacterium]|nr:lysylphosphatidylglycerol synthase domain-containing protein [Gemmatimonadales bacterium]
RLVRLVRFGLGTAVLAWVGAALWRNWSEVRAQPPVWSVNPGGVILSAILVWAMYAILIAAWRAMLAGWGQRLGPWEAARIWTVSSLGKYVPGKVWAVAGMALMAREAGVAPWAATASAVILQALAIGTGALVAGAAGSQALESAHPGATAALWALAAASALGVGLLTWPPLVQRLVRTVTTLPAAGSLPARPVLLGLGANLVAWLGYGAALWILARATLPEAPLGLGAAIGSFAASYVAGLLVLVAPGGLGVREGVFVLMAQGSLGWGGAAALAVASRLLLTLTELGAALPFLIFRRGSLRVGT